MVGARPYKCCGIYFPSKIQPLHPNVIDNEDDEKTGSNVRVQDPADDGMPIITGIIEFLYYPWEEEIQIQILCSMHGKGWRACEFSFPNFIDSNLVVTRYAFSMCPFLIIFGFFFKLLNNSS